MIPQRLLVHSCTYETPGSYDRNGKPTYNEPVTLAHVRIEPVIAVAKGDIGESKDDKLTLYYEPFFSTPAIVLEPLSRITWGGNVFIIRSVTPHYTQGGDAVHHYEAALV